MLGFAAPNGIEISNANIISLPPGPPKDYKASMDVTDEADDEFDEHVVGLSEGETPSETQSFCVARTALATRCGIYSRAPPCRGARSQAPVELTLRVVPLCLDIYSMAILARVYSTNNMHAIWISFLALLCVTIQVFDLE